MQPKDEELKSLWYNDLTEDERSRLSKRLEEAGQSTVPAHLKRTLIESPFATGDAPGATWLRTPRWREHPLLVAAAAAAVAFMLLLPEVTTRGTVTSSEREQRVAAYFNELLESSTAHNDLLDADVRALGELR